MSDMYVLVDPSAKLTWSFDWTEWLSYSSPVDVISSFQWTITPLNVGTPATPALTNATAEIVTAQGFELGKIYYLTAHVITVAGLEDERTVKIRCENT